MIQLTQHDQVPSQCLVQLHTQCQAHRLDKATYKAFLIILRESDNRGSAGIAM